MENVCERENFGSIITTEKIKASIRCFESTNVMKVLERAIIDRWVNDVRWLHDQIKSCSFKAMGMIDTIVLFKYLTFIKHF